MKYTRWYIYYYKMTYRVSQKKVGLAQSLSKHFFKEIIMHAVLAIFWNIVSIF